MIPDWLAIATLLPFPLFVLAYAFFPWYRNPAGRSVMLLAFTCTMALMFPVYREVTGERMPDGVRVALFVLILVAGWTQLITLFIVQRRKDPEVGSGPVPEPLTEEPSCSAS